MLSAPDYLNREEVSQNNDRGGAPVFKLVAADGGVWESQALENVRSYLVEALKDIPDREKLTIIA